MSTLLPTPIPSSVVTTTSTPPSSAPTTSGSVRPGVTRGGRRPVAGAGRAVRRWTGWLAHAGSFVSGRDGRSGRLRRYTPRCACQAIRASSSGTVTSRNSCGRVSPSQATSLPRTNSTRKRKTAVRREVERQRLPRRRHPVPQPEPQHAERHRVEGDLVGERRVQRYAGGCTEPRGRVGRRAGSPTTSRSASPAARSAGSRSGRRPCRSRPRGRTGHRCGRGSPTSRLATCTPSQAPTRPPRMLRLP